MVTQLSHPYPGARQCLLQGEIQVSHTAISPLHRGKTVLITGGNTGWSHSYLTPTQGQDSANYRGKYRVVTQLSHPYPGARQCLLQGEIQGGHTAISPLPRGKTVLITGGNTGWSHSYLSPLPRGKTVLITGGNTG